MKKAKLFVLVLGLLLNTNKVLADAQSKAAFLEPYAGIGQVQISLYNSTAKDYDDHDLGSGFLLGLKAGYAFNARLYTAFDYETGGPFVLGRLSNHGEWTLRMLGAGIGLDYDISRFWLGYYFDHDITDSKNQLKFSGNAFKAGFGLKITKNVHANIDITLHNLMTVKSTSTSVSSSSTFTITTAPKVATIMASISLPIELK